MPSKSHIPVSERAGYLPYEEEYLAHLLLEKRLSKNTAQAYLSDLRLCLPPKDRSKELSKLLDRDSLREFFAALPDLGFSPASLARFLASLRSYCVYLMDAGRLAADPTRGIRVSRQQRYRPR